jgi:hypothetical protein
MPPRHLRRTSVSPLALSVAFSAVVLTPFATPGLDLAGQRPAAHPVSPHTKSVPLRSVSPAEVGRGEKASAALSRAKAAAETTVTPVTSAVAVAGVSWPDGALGDDDTVQIRVQRAGTWGAWEDLDAGSSEHGPDEGTAEATAAKKARGSTDPYVVIGEQVQARVLSDDVRVPVDLSLSVVDPGSSPADASVTAAPPAGGATAAAARPTIYTRAQWGADESLRDGSPGYAQAHIAFVHHTAGSNSYTQADVPAIIRGIYAYHVNGQGWSDIGYNFLVDRFGRTWEGRYGGVDRAVIGAHTLGYNSWSFGVSAIGNFESTAVPSAVTTALTNLIAWKMTVHGMPPTGTVFAKDKNFARISGHRDAVGTECPGTRLYAQLPAIRSAVASRMGTLSVTRLTRDVDRAGQPDLLSYARPPAGSPVGAVSLLASAPLDPFQAPLTLGGSWNTVRLAVLSPDLTGDGKPDILAQYPAANNLRVYRGDGNGGVSGMVSSGSGWTAMKVLIAAGDQTGDGRADLMAVGSSGTLALYPGTARGTFGAGSVVATGWGGYTSVTGAGDLTGDGKPDLLAVRTSDGALVVAAGDGRGHVATPTKLAGGWGGLSPVFAAGDLDRDGHRDILGREPGGAMRVYYGDGSNAPVRWNRWGRGWEDMAQLSSGVDFTGDGRTDLLGVMTTINKGSLRIYPGSGRRDLEKRPAITGTTGADLVQLVGDVNADGYTDAVMRVGDALKALPGRSGGGFGAPVTVAPKGWAAMVKIAPGADQDGDGVPDVLATSRSGLILRYGFRRDFTLKPGEELEQDWQTVKSFTGTGAFNGDANGDVVALLGDGTLALFRGSGPAPLLDYTVLRSGQSSLVQIVGVGDYNGDGGSDVVAADVDGRLWLYAGRRNGTLWPGRMPMTGSLGTGQVLG